MNTTTRNKRRNLGLCINCAAPSLRFTRCYPCRLKFNQEMRDFYAKVKARK